MGIQKELSQSWLSLIQQTCQLLGDVENRGVLLQFSTFCLALGGCKQLKKHILSLIRNDQFVHKLLDSQTNNLLFQLIFKREFIRAQVILFRH